MTSDEEARFGDATVRYRRRISLRAKRLQVRVSHDMGVELVIPARAKDVDGEAFLQTHADWILEQLRHVDAMRQRTPRPQWKDGGRAHLLGRPCPIRVLDGPRRKARARYEDGVLEVLASGTQSPEEIRRAVFTLYQEILAEILTARVA
ncbi:MAG: DUF45 domain-containing protein, partial [Planctomycetes bacterium]|nr:DUF45 domain-containing protein [Planctomycetota bacterium]